ncbi:MAG: hypothetical protein JOZ41_03935 [Chloroflexi bacterium]|nr:hypothetical protein [Chloroflexota bacterium]
MTDSLPPESLARRDVATDLHSAVAARRELGPELEDEVVEAFLARVQQRIDAQVRSQIDQSPSRPVARHGGAESAPWVVPATLALSIPLIAIAGAAGGWIAILVVMVAVVSVFAIYMEYAKR